jgi:hypothetical protein
MPVSGSKSAWLGGVVGAVVLAQDAEFARHYCRPRRPRADEGKLQALAATWGAECGFQHDAAQRLYLLTVYKYGP